MNSTNDWHKSPALLAIVSLLLLAAGVGAWFITRGAHDEVATLGGHRDGAFCLALSPDGATAASGGGDGSLRLWEIASRGKKADLPACNGRVLAVAWSPDGTLLAAGGTDKAVRVFDAATGAERANWPLLPKAVRGLAFSNDGKLLAAAVDKNIHVFDLPGGKEQHVLRGHKTHISGIVFPAGRAELVTLGCDKSVRIWDPLRGVQVAQLPGPEGHCYGLSCSRDGKTLLAIGGGRVQMYDLDRRQPTDAISPNAHALMGGALSPDGQTLAIGSEDKLVVIWDVAAKQERKRLRGHGKRVGPVAFLPDNATVVTASDDGSLKLWKAR